MSRIGKAPIPVPSGVDVSVAGNEVTVKGPKGTLFRRVPADITVRQDGGQILVERPDDEREHRALQGQGRPVRGRGRPAQGREGGEVTTKQKQVLRLRRHRRVRKQVSGTAERPRLAVFRSNKHISAQVIDDVSGRTLASAGTVEGDLRSGTTGNKGAATTVGRLIAERAKAAGVSRV